MNKEENNSKRVKFSGLVLPFLEDLYKLLLDPLIKEHKLILGDEFWFFLSLGILSGILYFTGVNKWIPLLFILGAIINLLLHNSPYIRNKILPKESDKIDTFLKNLETKKLDEILEFIRYHQYKLDTNQIIQIINTKKSSYDLFLFIVKNQLIESELVEYLISNKLYDTIEADLINRYLRSSLNHISKEKYDELRNSTKDKKIIKTLNLCYPFYLKEHSIFKFFAHLIIKIRNAINYGSLRSSVFLFSLLTILFLLLRDPDFLSDFSPTDRASLAFLISIIGCLAIYGLIKHFIRIFRFTVYLFAPSE